VDGVPERALDLAVLGEGGAGDRDREERDEGRDECLELHGELLSLG